LSRRDIDALINLARMVHNNRGICLLFGLCVLGMEHYKSMFQTNFAQFVPLSSICTALSTSSIPHLNGLQL
jgi:hypothetical protein